ncbi:MULTISPECIES: cobalt-precorrin 5A hydrolase [Romboutsia]|uniref:Protein CbiG n=2 Tax=Romboutsia TaxID=1501226 RepID=A0A2P2BY70_9FIRM|nr:MULTISPECIES: cobalt-precorrin 5A hydrolase [Romboutsia]MCH1959082.1 cobalt-precorrin 5A hydrolase [Romboutsia hominis]MCH1968202.1 cobalt-precorrin 5A hydrolase [Romboutsia hominis]MDB8794777.1 cobalt-precorrin 5A hydrolase [Romboutsia sp. 1001216sp1]MDB8797626.1 cobalt-precorrin 5A hydrolase [Romboutsia sp. 1001216sp1]CEI74104.1 Protein CbiG [Romboutsia hominis]
MSIDNKIAIVCITENGKNLAFEIQSKLNNGDVYLIRNKKNNFKIDEEKNNVFLVEDKLSNLVPSLFEEYQYIVFIMATGIVVRVIAPYINNKFSDPAILVGDEKGQNLISLLSGHMGGANEMTTYISELIGANPVITTATDVNKKSSLDMIAKKLDAHIVNFRENVKDVNAMLVNNQEVGLYIDGNYEIDTRGFKILTNFEDVDSTEKIVIISSKNNFIDYYIENKKENELDEQMLRKKCSEGNIIKVVPKEIVIGIGCRRNTESSLLQESLNNLLHQYNIDINSIKEIGSIDVKSDEKAIIDLASSLSVPFKTFSVDEISKVDHLFEKSDFVKKNVGVYCVSEPVAYLLSEGNLIIEKHKYKGITISVGRVSK